MNPGDVPNLAERLMPIALSLPEAARPRFLATLERRAAERYLIWAEQAHEPQDADGLRRCAERERAIATHVERLFPGGSDDEFAALGPQLAVILRDTYDGRTLREQFAIQAAAERVGASLWQGLSAANAEDPARRDTLLQCARLEEESAEFLEALLGRPAPRL